jgi:hypothetical protein
VALTTTPSIAPSSAEETEPVRTGCVDAARAESDIPPPSETASHASNRDPKNRLFIGVLPKAQVANAFSLVLAPILARSRPRVNFLDRDRPAGQLSSLASRFRDYQAFVRNRTKLI